MRDVRERVRSRIRKDGLILPGERVLLGLSGGLDSVCLFHLLLSIKEEIPFSLSAAHLNHMLRGEAADADEAFVRGLCERNGIACFVKRVDVGKMAVEKGEGEELCGREARYEFFRSLSPDKIAVAHHMSDQAETVLMHLVRGSGAEGIAAISPMEGKIIRPLLTVSREELLGYAKKQNLTWREDATNASDAYFRNRLRHKVMPLLREENPKAEAHIAASADKIREDHAALEAWADEVFCREATEDEGALFIKAEALLKLPRAVRMRVLRRIVGNGAFLGEVHLLAAEDLLSAPTGEIISLPGGKVAERENESLRVGAARKEAPPFCLTITGLGEYPLPDGRRIIVSREGEGISLFAAAVKGALVARSRAAGDAFYPDRGRGRKKVKDYFIDRKIPRRERERAIVLADDVGILALLPFERDKRAAEDMGEEWFFTIRS